MEETRLLKVRKSTHTALKIAAARLETTILELFARIEANDTEALAVYQDEARKLRN